MKTARYLPILITLLLFFSVQSGQAASPDCLAAGCHPSLKGQKIPHQPAADGDCLACHEQETPEHPSGKKADFTLSVSGADLCAQCHELKLAGTIHPPVAKGNCLACHDPHGSENQVLLKFPVADLCLKCHPALRDEIKAKVRHAAVYRKGACGICHSGHASNQPALLLAPEKELCLSCHGKDDYSRSTPLRNISKEIEGRPYLHGPIAAGLCSPCHAPHGSPYPRLLRAEYPAGVYSPYRKEAYALCFECHDEALLKSPKTTQETGFRDGSRNLHFLHVANPRKGRVCTTCHASHASTNSQMIRDNGIRFGRWEIPVNFQATSTGGSCAPGCHQAVQYDRAKP